MDTNIGQYRGHTESNTKDIDVLNIKDIRNKSLQVFENAEYFNLALLKTEKLASALYLVSNLISDTEPLKWTVRKVSTDILSDITLMGIGTSDKGHKISLEKITAKIFEITSLLQVAWTGGLISSMNFEILKSEYFKLAEFLRNKFYSVSLEDLLVSEKFFTNSEIEKKEEDARTLSENNKIKEDKFFENLTFRPELPRRDMGENNFIKDINYKGQISDLNIGQVSGGANVFNLKTNEVAKKFSIQTVSKIRTENNLSDKNKTKRHNLIISTLRPNTQYSVPEILGMIGMGNELSEKTIQRDLTQLVSSGSLKKTGERRWSRYQLP